MGKTCPTEWNKSWLLKLMFLWNSLLTLSKQLSISLLLRGKSYTGGKGEEAPLYIIWNVEFLQYHIEPECYVILAHFPVSCFLEENSERFGIIRNVAVLFVQKRGWKPRNFGVDIRGARLAPRNWTKNPDSCRHSGQPSPALPRWPKTKYEKPLDSLNQSETTLLTTNQWECFPYFCTPRGLESYDIWLEKVD